MYFHFTFEEDLVFQVSVEGRKNYYERHQLFFRDNVSSMSKLPSHSWHVAFFSSTKFRSNGSQLTNLSLQTTKLLCSMKYNLNKKFKLGGVVCMRKFKQIAKLIALIRLELLPTIVWSSLDLVASALLSKHLSAVWIIND